MSVNKTEHFVMEVPYLKLMNMKVSLDSDISKAINSKAYNKLLKEFPDNVRKTIEESLGSTNPTEYAITDVVDYIKDYVSKNEQNLLCIKEDAISVNWDQEQWYVSVFYWVKPFTIFDSNIRRMILDSLKGSYKIPIPEPSPDIFTPIEEKKLDIVNAYISQNSVYVSCEGPAQEDDKIYVNMDVNGGGCSSCSFTLDSSFSGNFQLMDHFLLAEKDKNYSVGILSVDHETILVKFKITDIKRRLHEINDLLDLNDEIAKQIGFSSLKDLQETLQSSAEAYASEEMLCAKLDSIDEFFDHHTTIPELPIEVIEYYLEKFPNLKNYDDIKSYIRNMDVCKVFLNIDDDDPTAIDSIFKAWSTQNTRFQDRRSIEMWMSDYE